MKIVKMPLAKIKPAAYNPRKKLSPADKEYQSLRRSIQEFGTVEPLIVNKRTGNLVGGHQRLQILKDMGDKVVDVVEVDLEPKKEKALNVALNKITGRWDKHKLKTLLVDLDVGDFDIALTGFDTDDLKEMMEDDDQGPGPEDRIPPARKAPRTKPGDLWELGSHRILCGDSTKWEQVTRLTGGELASVVFTDPPYGVDYRSESTTQDFAPIKGDEKRGDDLVLKLLRPAFDNARKFAKDTAAFYIWHASSTREDFAAAMKAVGLEERQYLIWAKNQFVMGHSDYHWAHEPCFYASKAGHRPDFHGDRTNQTVWTAAVAQGTSAHDKRLLTNIANGVILVDGKGGLLFVQARAPRGKKARRIRVEPGSPITLHHDAADQSIWTVAKDTRVDHPTQKPVELAVRALENSSRPDEIVLDLFLGSGCTLIGAEKTGRRCFGMEMDPIYVDQAVDRWETITGKKGNRIQGGKA